MYPKEHFEAHRLLAEENPENEKLLFAWWIMSTKSLTTNGRYVCTPDEYEEAKIALSKAQSKAKKRNVYEQRKPPYVWEETFRKCKK